MTTATATVIDLGVLWVCVDCVLVRECGEAPEVAPDCEPWAALALRAGEEVAAGMDWAEHAEDCPNHTAGRHVDECECETASFRTSACDGCGSRLAGERFAYTLLARGDAL
jgi:hypothetical protein